MPQRKRCAAQELKTREDKNTYSLQKSGNNTVRFFHTSPHSLSSFKPDQNITLLNVSDESI